jgi:hypothetical protein
MQLPVVIAMQTAHQAFDSILGRPAWPAHLVIASRNQPPLTAIARLRVEGRLSELDEADPRLSLDETQRFLAASDFSLEEATLRQAAERTEGWPTALQLVCQAAQREPRPDPAAILGRIGDERLLFDYLAGQVLDRQPPAVQAFLRRWRRPNRRPTKSEHPGGAEQLSRLFPLHHLGPDLPAARRVRGGARRAGRHPLGRDVGPVRS